MWRLLRILILLTILVVVAMTTWRDRVRTTTWTEPLYVTVYPIAADDSEATRRFVAGLTLDDFAPIVDWTARQAAEHAVALEEPLRLFLSEPLEESPPATPGGPGVLSVMWWSLKLRYWAARVADEDPGPPPDIQLFALFHDPERSRRLEHSTGLQKGLVGVAKIFATSDMMGSNRVVLAHELLHVLGATDKYSSGSLLPHHPDGYAEPERDPLHPQLRAEIMAGRIPVSEHEAEIPEHLGQTVVGRATAEEIGWTRSRSHSGTR